MNKKQLQKIEKIVSGFFEKMGFQADVNVEEKDFQTLTIKIKSQESNILIGNQGETLFNIQKLLGRIIKKNLNSLVFVDLDINNYKQKKIEYLEQLARERADKVALLQQQEVLSPMPPYERRIIHLALKDRPDVTTESIGQDPERRVVIKPVKNS